MHDRKALAITAALAFAAGLLLAPSGAFARGGGFAGVRGPVFGFRHGPIVHRPIGPAFGHRFPGRFGFKLNAWRLHRFARQRNDASAIYPYGGDGGYGPYYDPNAVTGSVGLPGPVPALLPPAPYPPEHIGCLSRGYDVPGESGGVVRVTVTRC